MTDEGYYVKGKLIQEGVPTNQSSKIISKGALCLRDEGVNIFLHPGLTETIGSVEKLERDADDWVWVIMKLWTSLFSPDEKANIDGYQLRANTDRLMVDHQRPYIYKYARISELYLIPNPGIPKEFRKND